MPLSMLQLKATVIRYSHPVSLKKANLIRHSITKAVFTTQCVISMSLLLSWFCFNQRPRVSSANYVWDNDISSLSCVYIVHDFYDESNLWPALCIVVTCSEAKYFILRHTTSRQRKRNPCDGIYIHLHMCLFSNTGPITVICSPLVPIWKP